MTDLAPMTDDELADAVRDELTAAGLTVLGPEQDRGGVRVVVGDGVWVSWKCGAELSAAAMAVLRRGAYRQDRSQTHISLAYQGTVTEAMTGAIAAILTATGFEVQDDADDYHHPMDLLVGPRRAVPHWRDPIDPALDGASGFMPGVRVRVRSGEFAGAELTVSSTGVDLRTRAVIGYRLEHPSGDGFLDVPPDAVEFAADDFPAPRSSHAPA
ncbi:hypothetical protein [Actinoallomurus iriomotensis]|nr:hypothetical protein [Actinoallomurus iriomotensis]